jgi:hypothetical protein
VQISTVNVVQGNNRCLFWKSWEIHKYSMEAKCSKYMLKQVVHVDIVV